MIFNRLPQKYKCGCGRGVSEYKRTNILALLNSVIEWSWSEDHNSDSPSDTLIPGDVVELQSVTGTKTVCAVDSEDCLVQIISETGPFALKRFCEEYVIPEYELFTQDISGITDLSMDLVENPNLSGLECLSIPDYIKNRIIQDRLIPAKIRTSAYTYKINFKHDLMFGLETEIFVTNKNIFYSSEDIIDPECLIPCWEDILGYLYQLKDRIPRPSIDWEDNEAVNKFFLGFGESLAKLSQEERERFIFREGISDENLKKLILEFTLEEELEEDRNIG